VLAVVLAQPVEGERWPGATAQQTLASGAVASLDAHRAIDLEAAAVLPLRHRTGLIARQQATAHDKRATAAGARVPAHR